MAVSETEQKILGRIAKQVAPSNPLLSANLFQVLGLSILLSRKVYQARRVRRLDVTRDTRSLQLYHHIIWLAREGISITEVFVLPYCQNGEHGPECRVMAAKLRASLYHVYCLFHNRPPVSAVSPRSQVTGSSPSSTRTPRAGNGQSHLSPGKSPKNGGSSGARRRRAGSSSLRDPIPSMISDASYVTNPFAGPAQTPPPVGPPPPVPIEARRTPTRPPGLEPINIPAAQAAASFLVPPLNYVPMTREYFETAQHLASSLLPAAHALRLSVALEHAAFLWDCGKDHERAGRLARRTVREVYASREGLDDEEFKDAAVLVESLAGIMKRGLGESTQQPSKEQLASPKQQPASRAPLIDRTIAVSPTDRGASTQSPVRRSSMMRTPDRLSTVPEVESTETTSTAATSITPPISRLSDRSRRRTGSASSDKAAKRRAAQQAEEVHRRNSASNKSDISGSNSRQATPPEGYVRRSPLKAGRRRTGGNG